MSNHENEQQQVIELKDPVCGMTVSTDSQHHVHHAGVDYYFCCAGCSSKFESDPIKYLEPREPEPADPGAWYTCPMDPEVRQLGTRHLPQVRHGVGDGDA